MGRGSGQLADAKTLSRCAGDKRLQSFRREVERFRHLDLRINLGSGRSHGSDDWGAEGRIVDGAGASCGTIALRVFRREDPTGESRRVLHLANIGLNPSRSQSGFARPFLEHLEQAAAEHGCETLELWATKTGRYAWARPGWHFQYRHRASADPLEQAAAAWVCFELARPKLEILAKEGHISAADIEQAMTRFLGKGAEEAGADDLVRLGRGEIVTSPAEVALIGKDRTWIDEDGHEMWLGKALMLGNPHGWRGWLDLKPERQS